MDTTWVALGGLEGWTSTDGATWTPAIVETQLYMPPGFEGVPPQTVEMSLGDVISLQGELFSVGHWDRPGDDERPIVWRSTDGSSWEQVSAASDWGYVVNSVAASRARLATAVNYFGLGTGAMWTSGDGSGWTEHTPPAGQASMFDVVGDLDGFVAVGFRYAAATGELPVAWLSTDGETWLDAPQPPLAPGAMLLAAERAPTGEYVAVGSVPDGEGKWHFQVWWSPDGLVWEPAQVPTNSVDSLVVSRRPAVAVAGSGLITILPNGSYWVSSNGTTWTEGAPLPGSEDVSSLTAVASRDDQILLFGARADGQPLVWIGAVQRTDIP